MTEYIRKDAIVLHTLNVYDKALGITMKQKKWMVDENAETINIVRCKDCKFGHYDPDVGDYDCNEIGDRWHSHDGDWFCADGRMKGEEERYQ